LFSHLQIADPRERRLVGFADALLKAGAAGVRLVSRRRRSAPLARILLVRLERIGDLLMTRAAIHAVRQAVPGAQIDLIVGSWNASIARLIPDVTCIETLDAPWLARDRDGDSAARLLRAASSWRSRHYDLAINFEGDIRSHVLLALSGVRRRVGFGMAGGGPLLTDAVDYDPGAHTAVNALRLVERAFDLTPGSLENRVDVRCASAAPPLTIPKDARAHAHALLAAEAGEPETAGAPTYIALHPGGDRAIKRWAPERFAEVGRRLATRYRATVVLSGGDGDRTVAGQVEAVLRPDVRVVNLAGRAGLLTLAAVFERMAVLITGDTGPMHLAAAVGAPVVGVFGPSDPARWGPLSHAAAAVRIGLPCSPCNRIRRPPKRCVGHVPDCLAGIPASRVYETVVSVIDEHPSRGPDDDR
jgi:lipopolysaccharide heptosyltransferase II